MFYFPSTGDVTLVESETALSNGETPVEELSTLSMVVWIAKQSRYAPPPEY